MRIGDRRSRWSRLDSNILFLNVWLWMDLGFCLRMHIFCIRELVRLFIDRGSWLGLMYILFCMDRFSWDILRLVGLGKLLDLGGLLEKIFCMEKVVRLLDLKIVSVWVIAVCCNLILVILLSWGIKNILMPVGGVWKLIFKFWLSFLKKITKLKVLGEEIRDWYLIT